jgi:hypothetical protein
MQTEPSLLESPVIVEVFKTNVSLETEAGSMLEILCKSFPSCAINFDLDDCDKILRVAGNDINAAEIIAILNSSGFHCEALE